MKNTKNRIAVMIVISMIIQTMVMLEPVVAADKTNLALGKAYVKSEEPEGAYGDKNESESTDGILAGDYIDGKSYGYRVPENTTKTVNLIVDLGQILTVNNVKVREVESSYNYAADTIKIYESQDGSDYSRVSGPIASEYPWTDFIFSDIETRYIKVEFSKRNTGEWGHDWLFIDEIEVYHNENTSERNLALGKTYEKSEQPSGLYGDENECESTDGILAGEYTDGNSYGYKVPLDTTKTVDISVDLGELLSINDVRLHEWEGSSDYGADTINVYESQDGINYSHIDGFPVSDGKWTALRFSTRETRYIKVEFSKTNTGASGNDWMFIDEIEVYHNEDISDANLAMGKSYTKSEQPAVAYDDMSETESTDGILAGHYFDGKSYGYRVPEGGTKSVDITIDLEYISSINTVKVHTIDDVQNYSPDMVQVYTSRDGHTYDLTGSASTLEENNWFGIYFVNLDARYVRVNFYKYNDGEWGKDWLFIDDIQVLNDIDLLHENLALGKQYTNSEYPHLNYPDFNNLATDGAYSYEYADDRSYGYQITEGLTRSIDVTVDLEQVSDINNVKVHRWEGAYDYGADIITVYTSTDGEEFLLEGSASFPLGKWYDIEFDTVESRYVKVNFSKYNDGSWGKDYLFIDEIQVFNQDMPARDNNALVTQDSGAGSKFVCDGKEDDIEIQKAIDYISSIGGGVVSISPGTYLPNKEIALRNNVSLNMDQDTVLKLPEQVISKLTIDYQNGDNEIYLDDTSGFSIGMHIGLVRGNQGYIDGSYSEITDISNNKLTIYPSIDADYTVGEYCVSHYGVIGIFDANNVKIIGGEIDGNRAEQTVLITNADRMRNGIASGGPINNIEIEGVYIHDMQFQGIHPWGSQTNLVIKNNRCERNGAGGIVLDTIGEAVQCLNNVCINNSQSGLVCTNTSNTVINGGLYESNDYAGIELVNPYGNKNITIINAECRDNNIAGIGIAHTDGITVEDTVLNGNSRYGILVNKSKNIIFNDVSIANSRVGLKSTDSEINAITGITYTNCTTNEEIE